MSLSVNIHIETLMSAIMLANIIMSIKHELRIRDTALIVILIDFIKQSGKLGQGQLSLYNF